MILVKELLAAKMREPLTLGPDETVFDAIKMMAEQNVGALFVLEGEELIGVISERDYARRVILKGRASKQTPVRDIMTAKVVYVDPGQTLEECMALMTARRIRHLPVVAGGELVGVVSIGDVVKAVIAEKEFEIEQLTKYISAG